MVFLYPLVIIIMQFFLFKQRAIESIISVFDRREMYAD